MKIRPFEKFGKDFCQVWKNIQKNSARPLTKPLLLFMMTSSRSICLESQEFHGLTDEELCILASKGSSPAENELVRRYNRIVRVCARPLFLVGGDSEDLIQEGMVGLLNAIRKYDPNRDAAFRTFATICIRSRLASAVRAAQGDKHSPLNHSISFEPPLFDGNDFAGESPEDVIIGRE